jgi:hypothetical protein
LLLESRSEHIATLSLNAVTFEAPPHFPTKLPAHQSILDEHLRRSNERGIVVAISQTANNGG